MDISLAEVLNLICSEYGLKESEALPSLKMYRSIF
jgi:hypothetical protein